MTPSNTNIEYRKVAVLFLLLVTGLILLFQSIKTIPEDEISVIIEEEMGGKQNIDEVLQRGKTKTPLKLNFLVSKDDLQKRIEKMEIKNAPPLLREVLNSFYEGTQLLRQGRRNKNKLNLGRAIHKLNFSAETIPTFETFYNLGYAYFEFGDYEQAFMEFQKALDYEKDHPGVYNGLGLSLVHLGRVEEGLDRLHMGLSIAGSINDKAWKGEILGRLGEIYKRKSKNDIARIYLQEAIINDYEIGYMEGSVNSLCAYSEIKMDYPRRIVAPKISEFSSLMSSDSEVKKARGYLSEALDLAKKINYQVGVAKAARISAILHQSLGKSNEALDFFQQALAAYMNMENSLGQANILNQMARIYEQRGDFNMALKYYLESLLLHQQINHQDGKSNDLGNIGMIYYFKGDLDNALKYYQGALVVHEERGNQQKKSITLGNIGVIYLDRQEVDKALVYLKNALIIDRRIGLREGEALHLSHIGKAHLMSQSPEIARKSFGDSLKLYRQIGGTSGEARQLSNLAQYYLAVKDSSKALKYHFDSLATFREVGDIEGEASQMSRIGLLYREMGEIDNALKYLNGSLEIFESAHKQAPRKFAALDPTNLSLQMLTQK